MTADDKLNTKLQEKNDELREMRDELKIARDRYSNFFDHAPLGFVTLDAKGVILEINLTGAGLFGGEPSGLIGRPLISQIAKGDRKKIIKHLTVCKQGKSKVVSSVSLFTERGKALYLDLHTVPVHDPLLNQTLYRTALIDTSEVVELKSQLEQAALDEENNRLFIANELNEQIGRLVTAARMKLIELTNSIPSTDQLTALTDIRDLLDISIGRIGSLVEQITPQVMNNGGFEAAARQSTAEAGTTAGGQDDPAETASSGIVSGSGKDASPQPLIHRQQALAPSSRPIESLTRVP
jgi:PAS domain S-box-containing protein